MNTILYFALILLWGFTWFAIKNQLGIVPVEISLIYRFSIGAFILFFIMLIRKVPFRFNTKQHGAMLMLGLLLFSTNFAFLYAAAKYITSGIVSIIFSTSVIMIMLNNLIFFNKRSQFKMICGGLVGLIGLGCIFWPEIQDFKPGNHVWWGLMLALIGSYSFAWANQVSIYCSKLSIPLLSSTFYGMLYGIIALNFYCLLMKKPYLFDTSLPYVISLLYLGIPASVFGFLIYLTLVKRLGAEKAVYTTLFFPLVALTVSTYCESFHWKIMDYVGVALVITGNILVATKPAFIKRWMNKEVQAVK